MKYSSAWIAFVDIVPEEGHLFIDLIDTEDRIDETKGDLADTDLIGAWGHVLLLAPDIHQALDIIPLGLKEQNFVVNFIDSIENAQTLFDKKNLSDEAIDDLNWLLDTNYKFKITDRLFPYAEYEEGT